MHFESTEPSWGASGLGTDTVGYLAVVSDGIGTTVTNRTSAPVIR